MDTKVFEKKRGAMNDELAKKHEGFLGHPLTLTEIRLIPYIQYCAVNQQRADRSRMNADERKLLNEWEQASYLVRFPYIVPTREFWQFMSDVLFDFYASELVEVKDDSDEPND